MKNQGSEKSKEERCGKSYYDPSNGVTAEYINLNFPVIGIEKYGSVVKIIRGSKLPPPLPKSSSGKRGKVTALSRKSMSRLAFLTRENSDMFNSLLTLTYGDIAPKDGRELKRQLNRTLSYLRRRHDTEYVWFLEFTRRHRPHVHILLSHIPTPVDRFYLADYWANHVAIEWPGPTSLGGISFLNQVSVRNKMFAVHFHKRTWEPLRDKDGGAKYVTKYAMKLQQKDVPKTFRDVGRFWGSSRGINVGDPEFECDVTEDDLRVWLKNTMGRDLDHFDVLPKYVYLFDGDGDG